MFEESFAESWRIRFGVEPPTELKQIERLLTHRSVRNYGQQEVPEEIARALVGVAQSASTSSNLQLWSVVSVQDKERRDKVATLCANDQHVRDAAWFFCFLADHYRLKQAAARVNENAEGLDYTEFFTMAVIDAALAAERMVCAAEALGLGTCYIGGLRNNVQEIQTLLNLPEQTFGVFGLCIGWPAEDAVAEIKPRLSQDAIWFRETYQREVDVNEYTERMKVFYEDQNMRGNPNWAKRSGKRVDNHHLTGRENHLEWLRKQGFLQR